MLDDADAIKKPDDHNDSEVPVAQDEDSENFNWTPETEVSEPDKDEYDPMWSIVGSQPFADEARREWPAPYEEHQ